jgi:3-dehydroquinate synthase
MMALGADRHSLCINIGGGVIGDMGGFCAATFMRGITFIQMPTSLLSQVDASVGGKLGVDFHNCKNLIGLIQQPSMVFIDPQFLDTLPPVELRSGYAEMLKHGLIADHSYWNMLKGGYPSTNDHSFWISQIKRSIDIKKGITSKDPYERGLRKILNFGHTIGHAVESHYMQSLTPLLHGEAIAIGIICESYISYSRKMITKDNLLDISKHIQSLYDHHPEYLQETDSIYAYMQKDKKNKSGKIRMSLLDGQGSCTFDIEVDFVAITGALDHYKHL